MARVSLDDLAGRPEAAAELSPEARQALVFRALGALAALAAVPASAPDAARVEEDRLLDVDSAAQRLGVSPDWLYRRAGRLPFTVRLGRAVRFSSVGLARYIRQRANRHNTA
jgi:predicted DNA-binding transcriptional regulator AlpA